jgi:UDP-N-acetylmuramoyl-L-alanyl-D-glutamate--2,6-diaminopimelate ligase
MNTPSLKANCLKLSKTAAFVVNNVDDKYANLFRQAAHTKIVTYALQNQADVHWAVGVTSSDGIRGTIVTPFANITVVSRLSGEFNLKNILAAVATAINLNINDKIIAAALARVQSVPGRLQEIVQPGPARVFVDYAHTPDAIINVLQTLRTMLTSNGRLIAIFGCGGNRDRTKRPKMAQAIESLADLAIVTTDNPRFEEPETIIADAIQGFSAGYKYLKITDRKEAITETLKLARPGDIIAILGKGHETYQEIRGVRTPFYDGEIVENIMVGNMIKADFIRSVGLGHLQNFNGAVSGAEIDTRKLQRGAAFFALKGEKSDGHTLYSKRASKRRRAVCGFRTMGERQSDHCSTLGRSRPGIRASDIS